VKNTNKKMNYETHEQWHRLLRHHRYDVNAVMTIVERNYAFLDTLHVYDADSEPMDALWDTLSNVVICDTLEEMLVVNMTEDASKRLVDRVVSLLHDEEKTVHLTSLLNRIIEETPEIADYIYQKLLPSITTFDQLLHVVGGDRKHARQIIREYTAQTNACRPTSHLHSCGDCTDNTRALALLRTQDQCHATCQGSGQRCRRATTTDMSKYCGEHLAKNLFLKRTRLSRRRHQPRVYHVQGTDEPDLTADDYHVRASHNHTVYKRTGRRINAMRKMITQNRTCSGSSLFIPVHRVSSLYHDEASKYNDGYCGTFYFFERGSAVHIDLGANCRYFASKLHAYIEMSKEMGKNGEFRLPLRGIRYDDDSFDGDTAVQYIARGFKPLVKMNNIDDFQMEMYFTAIATDENDLLEEKDGGITTLPLSWPSLKPKNITRVKTGQLDVLDQPLCKMMKYLGIDTIILQHEVGEHDAVTEILDARDSSYSHLCQLRHKVRLSEKKQQFPKLHTLSEGLVGANGTPVRVDIGDDFRLHEVITNN
jgi:RNAse (barnase) inhibitor barstar